MRKEGKWRSYTVTFFNPGFLESRSSLVCKTEVVHPFVRLPLIPFHLSDFPWVTVKPRNRDDFFKSMTMYSQMCASHFRLQLTTNQLYCADGPIGRNSNRTVRSITFVLPPTASHISTSPGFAKSANPQLSSTSRGYCFALVSHWL